MNKMMGKQVQAAIREMRLRLGLRQAHLARELRKTTTTISRWETFRPPMGTMLAQLRAFAGEKGCAKEAELFALALSGEVVASTQELQFTTALSLLLRNRWLDGIEGYLA